MQKSTSISLFERFKQFINSLPVNSTYTTQQLYEAVGQYEESTSWKRMNKTRMYRTATYQTYLKRLGALENVKRGHWRVLATIPEWFNTKHINLHLGYTYHYNESKRLYIRITRHRPWNGDSIYSSVGVNPWDLSSMLSAGIPESMLSAYYIPKWRCDNPFVSHSVKYSSDEKQLEKPKEKIESVSVAAFHALEKQGLEVGAKVVVLASWPSHSPGYDCHWHSDMYKNIGKAGAVAGIKKVESSIDGTEEYRVAVTAEDGTNWWYPTMVLQVVERAPKIIKVKLNESYTADVDITNRIVKVGCQTIPFQSVYEVLEAMQIK